MQCLTSQSQRSPTHGSRSQGRIQGPTGGKLVVPCAEYSTRMGWNESTSLLSGYSTVDQEDMGTLHDNKNSFKSYTLIDTGATGYAFIDDRFARRNNFPLFKLKRPQGLTVIDGRPESSGTITHITRIKLNIY